MIILDSITKWLEVSLHDPTITNPVQIVSNWVDLSSLSFGPMSLTLTISSTSSIILPPPTINYQRQLKFLSINNQDTNTSTITINYNDNGNLIRIIQTPLFSNETLYYIDSEGFYVLDYNGNIKNGIIGPQGFQGLIGPIGSQGFQGYQGLIGLTGFQGPQGFQGNQGWQGIIGLIGNQGIIGPQGFQGYQGLIGPTGFQGNQGFQGIVGPTGFQGNQGFQGLVGPTGFQGAQGNQGFQGLQGIIGPTGFQGPQGWQGLIGLTGFQGSQGFQGFIGPTGFQGLIGPTGFQGPGTGDMILSATQTITGQKTFIAGSLVVSNSSNNPSIVFKTTGSVLMSSPNAGNLEVDSNGIFYYTHASLSRGILPTIQYRSLTSSYTLISQTAAQKIFDTSNSTITVVSSISYFFECEFTIASMSAGNGSFGFSIGGSASFNSISWTSNAMKVASLLTANTMQSTFNTTNSNASIVTSSSNTQFGLAYIRGTIRVNVGGTLIPQVSLGVASPAIIGTNSYFKIFPIGTITASAIGNWL